jgi:hypothetical protein
MVFFLGKEYQKSYKQIVRVYLQIKPHKNAKMGKRDRKSEETVEATSNGTSKAHSKKSILSDEKAVDPSLALLFASSVSTHRKRL